MARLSGFLGVAVLVLGLAPGAVAASAPSVDPSTLTPPPNPDFSWDCSATAQRILCTGVEVSGAVDADVGFSCDGRRILTTFSQVVTSHRTHDAAGRVMRNHLVGTFDEQWRVEGTTNPVVNARGRWVVDMVYAEPGVVESRTVTYLGTTLALTAPGKGVIAQDTGREQFNWDQSEVTAFSGVHTIGGDFSGAIAAACDVLGG